MAKEVKADLQNPCHQMLQAYPLYNYRVPAGDGKSYKLSVLVSGAQIHGSSEALRKVYGEILAQGQLLDTDLSVTVAVPDAEAVEEELYARSADLYDFVSISVDGKRSGGRKEPAGGRCLAELKFVTPAQDGDAANEYLLENAGFQYVVKVSGDGILTFMGDGKPGTPKHEFQECFPADGAALTALERVALNMHISYAKKENPHASYDEMYKDFVGSDEDGHYNYNANMKAALHVRSKVICALEKNEKDAGAETHYAESLRSNWDNDRAAGLFAAVLDRDPKILESLSGLEHQRWVLDKIMGGYRQTGTLDVIYQRPAGGKKCDETHGCNDDRWHTCLVPCDKSGGVDLVDEDFTFVEKQWDVYRSLSAMEEAGCFKKNSRGETLDALDRMSLKIHIRCRELFEERKDDIDRLLAALHAGLFDGMAPSVPGSDSGVSGNGAEAFLLLDEIESAVVQMRQHKKPAAGIYKAAFNKLRSLTADAGKAGHLLDQLNEQLLPLCEYVLNKDYKDLDRILVRQIPFALTHKTKVVLWKLMSGSENIDFFSTWNLEPEETVFLAAAEKTKDLLEVRDEMKHLQNFFHERLGQTSVSCIVFVPAVCGLGKGRLKELNEAGITVRTVQDTTIESLASGIGEALTGTGKCADYIDVTGCDPLLQRAAEKAVKTRGNAAGIFYVRDARLRDIENARELEYEAPEKSISVREMFELSGTVFTESETSRLSDFSRHYTDLWKIADRLWKDGLSNGAGGKVSSGNVWDVFCKHVMSVYKPGESAGTCYKFRRPSNPREGYRSIPVKGTPYAVLEMAYALRALAESYRGKMTPYIKNLTIRSCTKDTAEISFDIRNDLLDPGRDFRVFLEDCCKVFMRGDYFSAKIDININSNSREFIFHSLNAVKLPNKIPENKFAAVPAAGSGLEKLLDVETVLNHMADPGLPGGPLITDLKYVRLRGNEPAFSFRLASRELFSCIWVSGKVLEYYIYYAALLNSDFDDVEMGYKYRHSEESSAADNELDVICTKGMSSLFISAKIKSRKNLEKELKNIIYEINLQARMFGIQAKPVLAAPYSDMLKARRETYVLSDLAERAAARGTYLLGRECFVDEKVLAATLDSIMRGEEYWYRHAIPAKG